MGRSSSYCWRLLGGIFAFTCFLVIVIVVPLSIRVVPVTYVAFRYDAYTPTLQRRVYNEGRYVMNPATVLVTWSGTQIDVQFGDASVTGYGPTAVNCINSDGLIIPLVVKVQFAYNINELYDSMNFEFKDSGALNGYVTDVVFDSIQRSCSNFTSNDFYQIRGVIGDALYKNAKNEINQANAHVTLVALELENFDYPSQYNQAILATQTAQQDIEQAYNERGSLVILAQTDLVNAQAMAEITLTNANAQVEIINNAAAQNAVITISQWQERTQGWLAVKTALAMNTTEFINNYLRSEVVKAHGHTVMNLS